VPYQSLNPYSLEVVASFPDLDDAQIEAVLIAAQSAFEDWREQDIEARAAVLRRAAAALRADSNAHARLITQEMGKLICEAQDEVRLTADILDYYAEGAARMLAPIPIQTSLAGEATIVTRPLGPILCVEPWNLPYYQLVRVAAPNLAAGNTVIAKPASSVPGSSKAFERLMRDAGAPLGAFQTIFATNEQIATFVTDRRIRGVALTGSERAGAAVAAEAGKALKKSTMELGGSNPFLVLEDADLDQAVALAVQGRLMNTGQACAGSKRFVVRAEVADIFVDRFRAAMEALRPGDPLDARTQLGPLVSEAALTVVLDQIRRAVAGGATIITGGERLDRPGCFIAPTILDHLSISNPVAIEELFAPVAMIFRVADDEEAIRIANATPFGLGASIITPDIVRARALADRIDTGMAFINSNVLSAPELPFGGVKASGFGRELSELGIGEFVNRKLVTVTNAMEYLR
jgi:succinate-semialdehyde dehydrogenase/glutarate-semialdehyde dehydrogenase